MDKAQDLLLKNLEKLLAEKRVTVLELAKRSGITRSGVYKILNGERWPSSANLDRLSKALGTDIEYLFQGLDSGTAPAATDAEILSRISDALGLASRLGPDLTSFILGADEADMSSVRFLIEAQIKAVRAAETESSEGERKDGKKA